MTAMDRVVGFGRWVEPRSIVAGLVGSSALLALYLAIISLAQGVGHAAAQLALDAPFIGAITIGFGVQVALFVELRSVDRRHRASAAVTAVGTGTSAAAMLACCAHHLVDLLPIVGLSAAAVFLNAWKTPLLLLGIGLNIAGIVVIARRLSRARRACGVVEATSDGTHPPSDYLGAAADPTPALGVSDT